VPKIPSTHSEQGLWRLPPIAWEVPHGGSFFPAQGEVRTRHRRDVGPYEPVSHRPGPTMARAAVHPAPRRTAGLACPS
jgi:hypothetical protein